MLRIHKVIEQIMIEYKLNQKQVAQSIDVTPVMVTHYLRGSTKIPSFKVAKKIYDTYNLVTFPYNEEELEAGQEQLLMDFK